MRFAFFVLLWTSALHAEWLYQARDLGVLGSDRSEARSLNDNGWVVGKYWQKDQIVDFLWIPESGLQILTNTADNEMFPKINNQGGVLGCNFKPGSWFSSEEMQTYFFNPEGEFKLGAWRTRGTGFSVIFNDQITILSDHADVFKSTNSYFAGKPSIPFPQLLRTKIYPIAINNKSQLLLTYESPGLWGSDMLAAHELKILNIATEEETIVLTEGKLYYGVGLNDSCVVIARNKEGTEGFYGSKDLGILSLGDFIPIAINNEGDILGKKKKEFFLRKTDGTMIDLYHALDSSVLGIDHLTGAFALNNKGQILVTASIGRTSHAFLLESR